MLATIYLFLFVFVFTLCLTACVAYSNKIPATWGDFVTCVFLALIAPVTLLIFTLWYCAEWVNDDKNKRN